MSPDSEQFDELRRLLALKRYEQPPPAFFNTFSRQVILQIEAQNTRTSTSLQASLAQLPWLQRFWMALETKPVFAGAFGAAICGLLVTGMVYSSQIERVEAEANALLPVTAPELQPVLQFADAPQTPGIREIALPETLPSGTLIPPHGRASLFNQNRHQGFLIQPVSTTLP